MSFGENAVFRVRHRRPILTVLDGRGQLRAAPHQVRRPSGAAPTWADVVSQRRGPDLDLARCCGSPQLSSPLCPTRATERHDDARECEGNGGKRKRNLNGHRDAAF